MPVVNKLFQQARLSRGWTQEDVATLVRAHLQHTGKAPAAFDANAVSRLECGRIKWPGAGTRQALRTVFGVATDADLGLHGTRAPHTTAQEVSTTKRRTFLSMPLGAALPDLLRTPTRLGAHDVHGIAEHTRSLEEWDRRSGGRSTRHFAAMELQRVLNLRTASMTPAIRDAWCKALAALAGLTAWTTFDAGLPGATPMFALGLDAAREAHTPSTYCHIATNAARHAIHEGNAGRALTLTATVTGPHPPAVLAMVCAVTAQAHALRGDTHATLQAVQQAQTHAAHGDTPTQEQDWTRTLTPDKLRSDLGYALYRLSAANGHHTPDLVPQLRRAAALPSHTQPRARAMGAARLATVLYRQGTLDEAAHHARTASKLATNLGSARLDTAIAEMHATRRSR
ncbi:hypothetical protein [Streptomyces sp. NPDC091278]|uniref:helix-turn-helix domain-containing protein n=1 Tax=Streptomyces sp. NPDC091278 TaxID=3155301 RepID=UPI00344E40F7